MSITILFLDGIATPRSRAPSLTSPSTSIYYTDLLCPTNATSIVDCNATRTLDEACLSGEQEYFVTCFNVSGKYCNILMYSSDDTLIMVMQSVSQET